LIPDIAEEEKMKCQDPDPGKVKIEGIPVRIPTFQVTG
jgi:hypothetical protein